MAVPADLLEIIVCPGCHGDLVPGTAPEGTPSAGEEELVCTGCGNAYPVRDEIPVLLLDEARRPSR